MIIVVDGQRQIDKCLDKNINHNQIGCLPESGVVFIGFVCQDDLFNEVSKIVKEFNLCDCSTNLNDLMAILSARGFMFSAVPGGQNREKVLLNTWNSFHLSDYQSNLLFYEQLKK